MEDSSTTPRARHKVFFGWKIVAAGAVLNALAAGAYFTGFSVYFLPVTREFGRSRAAISRAHGLGPGPTCMDMHGLGLVYIYIYIYMGASR